MDPAQANYITTKKELLAIVFALDNIEIFVEEAERKIEIDSMDAASSRIQLGDLRQEGCGEHYSRSLEPTRERSRSDTDQRRVPGRADTTDDACNAMVCRYLQLPCRVAMTCQGASKAVKERLESNEKYYIWDDLYLWRLCNNQVTCMCIPESEIKLVLHFCHLETKRGHYGSMRTARKVLDCGLYWPTIF
ncbi:hypothetical protein CR513_06252, partial [Mucuna pruriens]